MAFRIHYNAPVILSFSIISAIVYGVNVATDGLLYGLFSLSPSFNMASISDYFSMFFYVLGHAYKDATGSIYIDHILGNLTFILLIGPMIEEKYGSRNILIMILFTALITAVVNLVFFSDGIVGASGIVFMLIILASFTNMRRGGIPITFILVMLLFVGKEVIDSFNPDHISQFAHILGGICGGIFGFSGILKQKKYVETDTVPIDKRTSGFDTPL